MNRTHRQNTVSAALLCAGVLHPLNADATDRLPVEPDAVEYVQVCDAYGTGFFTIPGTDTCLRISGFVRTSYEKVRLDGARESGAPLVQLDDDGTTDGAVENLAAWTNRGRLNIDTRSETDFGTLRALYRLEAGDTNIDSDVDMDVALISLGGFRAGFVGANFWTTNSDWVNFSGIGGLGPGGLTDEGFTSFDDATILDYTFALDGLSITVGVEDPRLDASQITLGGGGGFNTTNNGGVDGEVNFYAGFNYEASFGTLYFTAVHDSLATDRFDDGSVALGSAAEGGWAYRANLTLDLSSIIQGGKLVGQYSFDGDSRTAYVAADGLLFDPEAIYGIAFEMDLSDELKFLAQYSEALADEDENEGTAELVGLGLNWFPNAAPGFSLRSAYFFGEVEDTLGFGASGPTISTADRASYIFDGFFVGARRDF